MQSGSLRVGDPEEDPGVGGGVARGGGGQDGGSDKEEEDSIPPQLQGHKETTFSERSDTSRKVGSKPQYHPCK